MRARCLRLNGSAGGHKVRPMELQQGVAAGSLAGRLIGGSHGSCAGGQAGCQGAAHAGSLLLRCSSTLQQNNFLLVPARA
jgi:hypothetical protein